MALQLTEPTRIEQPDAKDPANFEFRLHRFPILHPEFSEGLYDEAGIIAEVEVFSDSESREFVIILKVPESRAELNLDNINEMAELLKRVASSIKSSSSYMQSGSGKIHLLEFLLAEKINADVDGSSLFEKIAKGANVLRK